MNIQHRTSERSSGGRLFDVRRRGRLTVVLALMPVVPLLVCGAGGGGSTQPTVTAGEAKLLESVRAVSATNASQAIVMLDGRKRERMSAALEFSLGNLYFETEQFDKARVCYESAVEKHAGFRDAMKNLGRVHLLQGHAEEAVRIYQSLAADNHADADLMILLGHALLLEEQGVSAESAFRQALFIRPGDQDAMLGLTRCLLQQERHREGLNLLKELLPKDPENPRLWALRASLLIALDRSEDALVSLECARRLGAASAGMLADLGDLYMGNRQPTEAVASYEEAFRTREPPIDRILRATEGLIILADPDEAAEWLAKITAIEKAAPGRLNPEQRRKLRRLTASLALMQGRIDVARVVYGGILADDPLDGESLLAMGDLSREAGLMEEAAIAYERAARIEGHEFDALVRQAEMEVERERYDEAVKLLDAAIVFNNRPDVAHYLEQLRRLRRGTRP